MENKITFIAGALIDIQSTIRAIDAKVGALLIGLLLPFSKIGRICSHFQYIWNSERHVIASILIVLFFSVWVLSISSLINALAAIDNPANHIVNSDKYKGSFYGGGLFEFGFIDAFINRSIVKANKDVSTYADAIPATKTDIEQELVFEQLKLIYIRDAKLHRLKWGVKLSTVWFEIGLFSYFFSKLISILR